MNNNVNPNNGENSNVQGPINAGNINVVTVSNTVGGTNNTLNTNPNTSSVGANFNVGTNVTSNGNTFNSTVSGVNSNPNMSGNTLGTGGSTDVFANTNVNTGTTLNTQASNMTTTTGTGVNVGTTVSNPVNQQNVTTTNMVDGGGANTAPTNMPAMREVVIDPNKANGNAKYIMTGLLFVMLLGIVWFMPEISAYMKTLKVQRQGPPEVITTGTLKCTLSRNSENYDVLYTQDFAFSDNKLDKLTYTIKTRGDMNLDEAFLDEMNTRCKNIAVMAKSLNGIDVTCDLSEGTMTEKHIFTYSSLNTEEVSSVYTEAGGVYPEYENKQDIDGLEKNKNAEGFTCTRIK